MTNDTEKKIVMDWFAPMEFFGAKITNWYADSIRIEFCEEVEYVKIDEICNGTADIKKVMEDFIEEIRTTAYTNGEKNSYGY